MRDDPVIWVCAVVGLLLLSLILIRRGLAAEADRRRRTEMELSALLRGFVVRQEEDHRRIARDVHDGLGQLVAFLQVGLDALMRDTGGQPALCHRLAELKAIAAEMGEKVSGLAWELRPAGLEGLGLTAALTLQAERITLQTGLPIDCDFGKLPEPLPDTMEDTIFRITQEATTNIVRHAGATRAAILLHLRDGALHLIVEDNGIGFNQDAKAAEGPRTHLGLLGIRERVAMVGGRLEIETSPGHGTTLFVTIPL
jgi:signal transduction histidine kinase